MTSNSKPSLETPNDLFQHTPQSKKISPIQLHTNQAPIGMINFRHLQAKNLEAFQLFPKNNYYFDNVKEITKACQNSDYIRTLTIKWTQSFSRLYPMKGEIRNTHLLSEKIKFLSSLQALDLSGGRITDYDVELLCQGIKRLGSLRKLRFSCIVSQETISDKSLVSLSGALKKLVLLEDLDLDFASHEITDLGAIELSKGLKRCSALKRLRLVFISMKRMKNGISNKGLDKLCEVIKRLVCLERLELNFTDFSGMGNDGPEIGLKSLSESLKKLEKLKDINLTFSGRQKITDDDLRYLGEGLKALRELSSVSFFFGNCQNITNFGFEKLCEGLDEMEFLKILRVRFYGCKIQDEGLIKLGKTLQKMSLLERFDLDLRSCEAISECGLEGLREGLMQLVNIKSVLLTLSGCAKVEKDQLEKLKAELESHFPSIQVFLN